MKNVFFKLFLLITFLFLSSGDLLAQVNWTKYEGNPVITVPGAWYNGAFAPYVIYNADSSRYEMFFTGASTASGGRPCRIGLAYSNDGLSWQVRSTPVLTPSAGQWDSYTVELPYVIYENGSYKMWYSGALSSTTYKIGYATSLDGINWTKHLTPVLEAGTDAWEVEGVASSYVMPVTGGYKMWYVGANSGMSKLCIGYATSTDGILWQKDTQNNPILEPGISGEWDDTWVTKPSVMFKDNIYYMWYLGTGTSWGQFRIGLATSPNGINNWTKYPTNPVLRPSASGWDGGEVESPSVLLVGDTLYMYYDGSPSGNYVWKIGLAKSLYSPPITPGTYTVGTGGNFATIQEAFNKLETDGVAGNVTLELIDELYVAPAVQFGFQLNGPIPGAGPNSRVTIKPAENKNVVIQGDREAVLFLVNTSYVTFDGVAITGSTTLTIHAHQNSAYVFNDALDFINNSDHNIIQNITFIVDDNLRASGSGFWYTQTGAFAPDSNLIQKNFFKKAGVAFFVVSPTSTTKGKGNSIRENQIGSEIDSLITHGIQATQCENTIIENNIIQNLKLTISGSNELTAGISSVIGSGDIIRNNVIRNLRGISGFTSSGIILWGQSGYPGNNNYVYNNMIYDINSTSAQPDSRLAGIQVYYQNSPKIYYNSIYLSGTGENQLGSAALYIYSSVTNADVKNNIFVNTRDEGQYCASAIYDYSVSNLTSDYNDLYYDDTNNNNCLVRIGSTNYNTLADWQATLNDLHSYVEMPHFVEPYLHIDPAIPTYIEARGTPIAGIEYDFDGDLRNTLTPDIGADEIDGTPGVGDENVPPTEFVLEQNYPNPFNPSTTFRYSIPQTSKVVIKVYDILGNEIALLMDEEKTVGTYELTWNAVGLSSGIYFYQLKAGEFVQTRKMLLIK
jgi:predicted GH43/DUF377 family glycosyl hydrolase